MLVFAATNRAEGLDPALLRPGRFDRTIHFDLPPRDRSHRDRRLLPGARSRTIPSVNAVAIADRTAGYSPVASSGCSTRR